MNRSFSSFCSPDTSDANFLNGLERNIEKALEISTNVIVLGDLNEDLLNSNVHGLKDVMLLNSLINAVSGPSRITINDDLKFLDALSKFPPISATIRLPFITLPFQYYEPKKVPTHE